MTKKIIGLALGGGAARGLAHVGVLKGLIQSGISVDCVAGTSAGAIVGGLFAAGIGMEQLVQACSGLRWSSFVKFQFSKMGLFSSKPLDQLLDGLIGSREFSHLNVPLAVLATDIQTGMGKIFSEGSVTQAIKASYSFPGVFEPTEINGRWYCDGGASGNVPSYVVRQMGANVVLAVDVIPALQLEAPPRNLASMVDRGLDILLHHVSVDSYKDADILLQPVTEYFNSFNVRKGMRMIELGQIAVEQNIERIRKLVE